MSAATPADWNGHVSTTEPVTYRTLPPVRWRDDAGNAERFEREQKRALERALFYIDLACRTELSGDKITADFLRRQAALESKLVGARLVEVTK